MATQTYVANSGGKNRDLFTLHGGANLPLEKMKFQNLQTGTPDILRGILRALQKAHWWCSNPLQQYDRSSGVQINLLKDEIVVGFRGSASLRDVLTDLRIGIAAGPFGANCHRGFVETLQTVDADKSLLNEIKRMIQIHSVKKIVFSGYSLGGAIASLFLLENGEELLEFGVDVKCITFGCPRFVLESHQDKLPTTLTSRIINTYAEGDPIPLDLTGFLPWASKFCHVGNSLFLSDTGKPVEIHRQDGALNIDNQKKWWSVISKPLAHLTEYYERVIQITRVQEQLAKIVFSLSSNQRYEAYYSSQYFPGNEHEPTINKNIVSI